MPKKPHRSALRHIARGVASEWLSRRVASSTPIYALVGINEKRWGEMDMKQKMAQVKRGYKRVQKALQKGDQNAKSAQGKLRKWVFTHVTKQFGKPTAEQFWSHLSEMGSKGKGKDKKKGLGQALKEKTTALLKGIKGVSKKLSEALVKSPPAVQKFFTDSKHRKKVASTIREKAPQMAKNLGKQFLKEGVNQVKAARDIVRALPPKSEALTKEEKKRIFGSAVYWAGFALSGAGPALGGAGFWASSGAGSKALLQSMSLHAAVITKAGAEADDAFLGVEVAETAHGTAATADVVDAVGFGTGDLPGAGHLIDFITEAGKSLVATHQVVDPYRHLFADEKGLSDEEEKVFIDYLERFIKRLAGTVENFNDKDIEAILKPALEKS